ncbi:MULTISPECIES: endonuclease/exonuclease/phosphatase family protein [Rhodopseudomonas]|nr:MULTISPECIES: endonuclease/exonuclease/phosphatase family protein [Rhodopseudomonas]MDF3810663.1 endonuclease/exonuclease/phosphatase family protein [Rhodopseudomonas sp. BAL398]WOK18456.1 endonuclease/exonuclease/phosphatase family protein [Rhodopseudomonas sp. BAL398]
MTWNVHGTFTLNPGFDLPGVIALIQKWSPDIIAIQEIDSRSRDENPFDRLQSALGGSSIGALSIVTADGDYGQMLISRWPWARTPIVNDISFGEREPRRAISADILTPRGPLRVVATHLGLSIRERRQQAGSLLRLAEAADHPAVVIGDLNDWFWINSVRGVLAQRLRIRTRNRTFPSRFPLLKLDRIYGCGIRLLASRVDPAARVLSDHLPVIADIRLDPQPAIV